MLLNGFWRILTEDVFPAQSSPLLFNQYKDDITGLDLPGGSLIRRGNLRNYLLSFSEKPPALIVGEAAGPWGARFSGIPFTGERQLIGGAPPNLPFRGRQSSTHEPPYLERSGTVLWKTLLPYYPKFILHNSVPLHPHLANRPLTIRKPTKDEIRAFSGALYKLIELLTPSIVVSVGRTAEHALEIVGVRSIYVRHPSMAGVPEFKKGITKALASLQ